MKSLIVGLAVIVLFAMFITFQHDFNTYQRELEHLKLVADEASGTGAIFFFEDQFGEGKKTINQLETIKAIEYIIIYNLKLDDYFFPLSNSYWTDKVKYQAYFFDDSNTTLPYMFTDPLTEGLKLITEPSVIVSINAGNGRFKFPLINLSDSIRSSAYEYYTR